MIGNIRIGTVSSVDAAALAVKVTLPELEGVVSGWLKIVFPFIDTEEVTIDGVPVKVNLKPKLPKAGDSVQCCFIGPGIRDGFCTGKVGGL